MEDKNKLLEEILQDVDEEMTDEEIIHLLLDRKMAKKEINTKLTVGEKTADSLAKFAGSWTFIIIFMAILCGWMMFNSAVEKKFDPYPFILLNLVLSCLAAMQAPIIMMSQNRQEEKDRQRAENDYRVNVKTEIILSDLHVKIDQLLKNQEELLKEKNKSN
ncbi:DUF1003 domain-containing protein [Anaerorhabdus sp.]|jgi:uncharacterized membrane protein|uniref:DUF1003 domain-containing protein n=1 Tax=Anaerorhabdus sp. TaxID=1872524 RepID=UPI002FC7C176